MTEFVRKNVLTFATTFTANDGSTSQPGGANCQLRYKGATGWQDLEIQMTYNPTLNQWSCTWDSSAALEGTVSWMIYGYGTLQAATQGEFQVNANAANKI